MAEAFIRSGLQMAANDVDGEDSQLIQGSWCLLVIVSFLRRFHVK